MKAESHNRQSLHYQVAGAITRNFATEASARVVLWVLTACKPCNELMV
ncbi:MAG: hypothetical protein V7K92_06850 [Nostoc sp.]